MWRRHLEVVLANVSDDLAAGLAPYVEAGIEFTSRQSGVSTIRSGLTARMRSSI